MPGLAKFERFRSGESDLFQTGLYKRQLLVSKEPVKMSENIMTQYFDINALKPKFDRQVPFVLSDRDKKEFHDFKIVEIINSTEVRDLFIFTHPKYSD